jgi:predicted amidophosphoribosyltransferase
VFSTPLADIIKRFKYEPAAAGWSIIFGRLVLGWLDRNATLASQYSLILPNPTHAGRQPLQHIETVLRAAQVEDVSRRWPIQPQGLLKTVDTPRSAGHGWADKQTAAQQHAAALAATVPLTGTRILLFDDVFTSGSQLDAIGRRLRASGALQVDGLVLARVPWST